MELDGALLNHEDYYVSETDNQDEGVVGNVDTGSWETCWSTVPRSETGWRLTRQDLRPS